MDIAEERKDIMMVSSDSLKAIDVWRKISRALCGMRKYSKVRSTLQLDLSARTDL